MEKIVNIFQTIIEILGNPYLEKVFEKYKDDEKELYKILKDYTKGLLIDLQEDEEENENSNNFSFQYIYLNGILIDYRNISRVELDKEYNQKKNNYSYYIRIIKKYPSPLEEEYIIPFNSEEERDKGFELLKAKMKICKIYSC